MPWASNRRRPSTQPNHHRPNSQQSHTPPTRSRRLNYHQTNLLLYDVAAASAPMITHNYPWMRPTDSPHTPQRFPPIPSAASSPLTLVSQNRDSPSSSSSPRPPPTPFTRFPPSSPPPQPQHRPYPPS